MFCRYVSIITSAKIDFFFFKSHNCGKIQEILADAFFFFMPKKMEKNLNLIL